MKKNIFTNIIKRSSELNRFRLLFSKPKISRVLVYREIFYFISLTLFIFIILEIIFPRIILVYFNLNFLFLLVIFSGLLTLVKK